MNRTPTHTAVYPQAQRPSRYDGAHFLCYLNESEAEYKPDEDSEAVPGIAYSGDLEDGPPDSAAAIGGGNRGRRDLGGKEG